MSKRLRSAAVPIVLLAIVAAACSKSSTGGSTNSAAPNCPSDFKVGLALDVGGLGDQSFNDAANRGLQKAISDGLVCKDNVKLVPANAAESNLDDNTQALASAGYK